MGLLNSIALSYLFLISFVIFIYFYNKQTNVIYVSSILPWKELKTDVVSSRMFRFNLLLLLQIFLLMLLALFLAKPYLSSSILVTHGKNKLVVIDTSASMQTIEKEGIRFEQAKEGVLKLINKMMSDDKMMIISAYSSSETVIDLEGDKELLRKAVNDLRPTETGSDLEGGISLAISYMDSLKNSQLFVFTDQRLENCGLNTAKLDPKTLNFVTFGKADSNVAISSFDVFQDMFNEKDEAYITLKNYSDQTKEVKLTVNLEQDLLMENELRLLPGEQKTFTIRDITSTGILKAQIYTNDVLKADNIAYGIIKKRKKAINILLVTNSSVLKEQFQRLEQAFKQMKINPVSTDDYNTDTEKAYDTIIFHNFVPDKEPSINSLFLTPVSNNKKSPDGNQLSDSMDAFLTPKGIINDVKILDWEDAHPVMKYLNYLDNITVSNALLYNPPKGSDILIYVSGKVATFGMGNSSNIARNDMPLAFSTNLNSKKIVVLGMNLEDLSFSEVNNLPLLIMTLNIIQWLSPLGENLEAFTNLNSNVKNQIKTGEAYYVHDTNHFKKLSLINDGREPLTISENATSQTSIPPNSISAKIKYTGVYKVEGNDKNELFVANFFDESESDLKHISSNNKAEQKEPMSANISEDINELITSQQEINEISRYILYLVPIFLLIEWIYYFARKSAW